MTVPAQLVDQRALVVDLLLRQEVLPAHRLVAGEIPLGAVQLGLVAGQRRLPLVQQDLERAGIDLGQHLALLDRLPLAEDDPVQAAVDLRADVDGLVCRDRSQPFQVDGHVTLDGRRQQGRDGAIASRWPLAAAGRRSRRALVPLAAAAGEQTPPARSRATSVSSVPHAVSSCARALARLKRACTTCASADVYATWASLSSTALPMPCA